MMMLVANDLLNKGRCRDEPPDTNIAPLDSLHSICGAGRSGDQPPSSFRLRAVLLASSATLGEHTHGLWAKTAPPGPETTRLEESTRADVVILGAGYAGLSAALHLAEAGTDVAVLEASDIGFGGAGRNVGLVNAGLWTMPDHIARNASGERLVELLGHAPDLVFDLIKKHRIECEAVRAGTLHCAIGAAGWEEVRERERQWRKRGAPVQLIGCEDTAKRTGTSVYTGAVHDARAGTIQPLAYVRGLGAAAVAAGARIYTQSEATDASPRGSNWVVRTDGGEVTSAAIIVATDAYARGPFSAGRTEQVLLPYFNCATAPLRADVRATILPGGEGAWDTRTILSSFRLDGSGRLIFGSVGALKGCATQAHVSWAQRALRTIFPQLEQVSFQQCWYGSIGMTDDSLPRFHRHAAGVFGFSGYNGRGIAPGTVFGRLAANYALGRIGDRDLPVPVTAPREPLFRPFREAFYEYGAHLAHLVGARPRR